MCMLSATHVCTSFAVRVMLDERLTETNVCVSKCGRFRGDTAGVVLRILEVNFCLGNFCLGKPVVSYTHGCALHTVFMSEFPASRLGPVSRLKCPKEN